jgi:hypothetical protein
MAQKKNRKDIINDDIAKSLINLNNSWGYDDYDDDWSAYYFFDDSDYNSYTIYKYTESTRDGSLIDLDSLSKERKRESIIKKILGEIPDTNKNTIGDFYDKENRNI